jgi:hypothetical protein
MQVYLEGSPLGTLDQGHIPGVLCNCPRESEKIPVLHPCEGFVAHQHGATWDVEHVYGTELS